MHVAVSWLYQNTDFSYRFFECKIKYGLSRTGSITTSPQNNSETVLNAISKNRRPFHLTEMCTILWS